MTMFHMEKHEKVKALEPEIQSLTLAELEDQHKGMAILDVTRKPGFRPYEGRWS